MHLDAVVLAGYSKHVLFVSLRWVTSLERQAGALMCVWESVRVCAPLCFEMARLQLWRVRDATAERPEPRCVALGSVDGSAGQGL